MTQPSDLAAREARANEAWLEYCRESGKHPDDDAGCKAWQEIMATWGIPW